MLVYSFNLVFLSYIYMWGTQERQLLSETHECWSLPGFSAPLAFWSHDASGVRGATSPRHLRGQQRELRTPAVTPQGRNPRIPSRRLPGARSPRPGHRSQQQTRPRAGNAHTAAHARPPRGARRRLRPDSPARRCPRPGSDRTAPPPTASTFQLQAAPRGGRQSPQVDDHPPGCLVAADLLLARPLRPNRGGGEGEEEEEEEEQQQQQQQQQRGEQANPRERPLSQCSGPARSFHASREPSGPTGGPSPPLELCTAASSPSATLQGHPPGHFLHLAQPVAPHAPSKALDSKAPLAITTSPWTSHEFPQLSGSARFSGTHGPCPRPFALVPIRFPREEERGRSTLRKRLTRKLFWAFVTPRSAGFRIPADTHPGLAGSVALVIRAVVSFLPLLPPSFLLHLGFKLHKAKGAAWRRVDGAARTESGGPVTCAAGGGPAAKLQPGRVFPWSPEHPALSAS
ncbi:unnamed protein product [Nyctereutes procyonoides]|uniref:(raccoon dog) hypothetical protein n=1 Tax=Nyctereutes procyonoides TaxID=34880 RepID=A0A811ZY61_NYCPR|nr:unnamed protein product [Nyctereutes procyonoides]